MIFKGKKNSIILTASLSALLLLLPGAVSAQESSDAEYNRGELESFIMANSGIYQLRQQVDALMPQTETDEQKQQVMQAFDQQASQVVTQSGLTIEEYQTMSENIQADPALQDRTNSVAQEMVAAQQAGQQ